MADPDLQIWGGGGVGEGGAVPQIFFRPFAPQFGLKIRGLAPPLDPPLLKGAGRVVCLH